LKTTNAASSQNFVLRESQESEETCTRSKNVITINVLTICKLPEQLPIPERG
jgi:hypothetical protein